MRQYTPLIVSVCAALLAVGGVWYMARDIHANTNHISEIKGLLAELSDRDLRARLMQESLERVRPLKASLDAYIVGADDVVLAIELIESVARREGVRVSLSSVTVVANDEWEHHEGLEVILTATGTFPTMTAFSSALEVLPRAARVREVMLEASAEGAWFGRFTVIFVKEAYE